MAEKPLCKKCGIRHWNVVSCAKAADTVAVEREQVPVRQPNQRPPAPPKGYMHLTSVPPWKYGRVDAVRPGVTNHSAYIQIEPGKFGLRKNYVVQADGTIRRKAAV